MRFLRVKIRRDTQTVNNSLIAPWEIPVLEYLFEQGNVEKLDSEEVSREYPDAGAEWARLVQVYGSDSKTGIPHIVSVYGEGSRGLKALREAIDEEKAAAKKPAAAKSKRKTADDALLA
jgi:hypothetical protein